MSHSKMHIEKDRNGNEIFIFTRLREKTLFDILSNKDKQRMMYGNIDFDETEDIDYELIEQKQLPQGNENSETN